MLIQFLRTFLLGLLIASGLLNYNLTIEKEWLWIIGSGILIAFLFVDIISAFIFLLIIIAIYLKVYHKWNEKKEKVESIQSNVVDEMAPDYKGINGVYGEEVYGAQGSISL
jgi:hypothetical protein